MSGFFNIFNIFSSGKNSAPKPAKKKSTAPKKKAPARDEASVASSVAVNKLNKKSTATKSASKDTIVADDIHAAALKKKQKEDALAAAALKKKQEEDALIAAALKKQQQEDALIAAALKKQKQEDELMEKAKLGAIKYANSRITSVDQYKHHPHMLNFSAASYCMTYETRLPNLSTLPTYDSDLSILNNFICFDLHRTLHAPHNCTILDIDDLAASKSFLTLLQSCTDDLYPRETNRLRVAFQGGVILYLATAVESLVYLIVSNSKKYGSDVAVGVDHALLALCMNGYQTEVEKEKLEVLRPLLAKYIQRISTQDTRSTTIVVTSAEPFPDQAIDKITTISMNFLIRVLRFACNLVNRLYDYRFLTNFKNPLLRFCYEDILNLLGLTVKGAIELDAGRENGYSLVLLLDHVRKGVLTELRNSDIAKIVVSDSDAALLNCGYHGGIDIGFNTTYRHTNEYSDCYYINDLEKPVGKKPLSNSARAGLQFSVFSYDRLIRDFWCDGLRIGACAPVYLASVCEYLASELLQIAAFTARDHKCMFITRKHVYQAILKDEEFRELFTFRVSNPFTGALYRNQASHFYRASSESDVADTNMIGEWWEKDNFKDRELIKKIFKGDFAGNIAIAQKYMHTGHYDRDYVNYDIYERMKNDLIVNNNIAGSGAKRSGFILDRTMLSITRVLYQVCPKLNQYEAETEIDGLTEDGYHHSCGILAIHGLVELFAIQLLKISRDIVYPHTGKVTFNLSSIRTAAEILLPGQLLKHALQEGEKAAIKFTSSTNSKIAARRYQRGGRGRF